MDPADWIRLQEVFDTAADLPLEQRDIFLNEACAGNEDLRREVEALLSHDGASTKNLEGVVKGAAESYFDADSMVGTRLGPWRIVRQISQGGMGTVYLASRDDNQYQQQVALKMIRPGLLTAKMLGRFRLERQVLANLKHPYIAHLIDGGTAADGRPYLVMEHVDGEPIDGYCRQRNLGLKERCALFIKVCEAAAYAHRNHVVHRDLKPGNILITPAGEPKLIDFGVAKLLSNAEFDPKLTQTQSGWLFTPEYASPEQVRGQAVTPATDVYCLGAVLFEVLTGARAHKVETANLVDFSRMVCEQEVRKPSASVDGNSAEAVRLRKQLAGDLDNVVLKAMAKEPAERYASGEELRVDLERYMHGSPVTARSGSVSYRVGKFVRRHKVWVAAGLLGLVLSSVAVILTVRQVRRQEAVRLTLLAREDMNQFRDSTVRRGLEMLDRAIAIDPTYAPAHSAKAVGADWLGNRFGNQRAEWESVARKESLRALELDPSEPEAHSAIGDILFFRDWKWNEGESHLAMAARSSSTHLSWQLNHIKALSVMGRFQEGLTLIESQRHSPEEDVDFEVQKALLLFYMGRNQESIDAGRRIVKRDPNGHEGPWVLGMALTQAGQLDEAISVMRAALNRSRRDSRLEAALGNTYGYAGRVREAMKILDLTLRPPSEVSPFMCPVCAALIYAGLGDSDNAVLWLERAAEKRDGSIPFVPIDPRYSKIAGDSRFVAMKERIRKGD